jgi:hypothetical protein
MAKRIFILIVLATVALIASGSVMAKETDTDKGPRHSRGSISVF